MEHAHGVMVVLVALLLFEADRAGSFCPEAAEAAY